MKIPYDPTCTGNGKTISEALARTPMPRLGGGIKGRRKGGPRSHSPSDQFSKKNIGGRILYVFTR